MSLYTLLKGSFDKFGDKPALSTKKYKGKNPKYEHISFKDLNEMVDNFASGMIELGKGPKGNNKYGKRVAIMSNNREEFIAADIANAALGNVTVMIYDDYKDNPEKIGYILQDSEAEVLIVSGKENYDTAMETLKRHGCCIDTLITMDEEGARDYFPGKNIQASFDEIIDIGKSKFNDINGLSKNIKESDLATLMYTSGTTGNPKGVKLTHQNINSNIKALAELFDMIGPGSRALSVIPYAHALEHTAALTLLYMGADNGFAECTKGENKTIAEDMLLFKPTLMIGVPRLYETVLDKVKLKIMESSHLKQTLFNKAVEEKEKYLNGGKKNILLGVLDHLVFEKIRKKTGGCLEFCITGGGPLSPEIEHFFSDILDIKLYNGYGLTESSPVISVNTPDCHRKGSIGKAIPEVDIKIIDPKRNNVLDKGKLGEVIASGPNIFEGYWNNSKKTNESFIKIHGINYLRTKDIGRLDKDGFLYIGGRIDDSIRLRSGQNIDEVNRLEDQLKEIDFISEVMIHGHGELYLTGLVVPNYAILGAKKGGQIESKKIMDIEGIEGRLAKLSPIFWNAENIRNIKIEKDSMPYKERLQYALDSETYKIILAEMEEKNKEYSVPEFARLRKFAILPYSFIELGKVKVEENMESVLTPTLKLKRQLVYKSHKNIFDILYE